MQNIKKLVFVLLPGILLLALGTSVCNLTGLGIDPFNAFCTGGARLAGMSLGTFVLMAHQDYSVPGWNGIDCGWDAAPSD